MDIKNAAHVTAAGHGLELVPIHRPAMFEVRTGLTSDYGNVQANIVCECGKWFMGYIQ